MTKESVSSIMYNSGASLSITNDKTDFDGTLKPCPYRHLKVKGVAQAIKVHGQGTVLWSVLHVMNLESSSFVHPRCQGQVVKHQQSWGCSP